MNILYLANHLNIGGITSYILTLSSAMKKRGHKVFVASSGGEALYKFHEEGVTFIPIPIKTKAEIGPKVLLSYLRLRKIVKEENIDIIHANTRVTQVLACLLARSTRKAFVSTCHGFFKQRFTRRLFPCWGKKVIAISAQVKEHLIKDFHVKEEFIEIIHNGIDINRFARAKTEDAANLKNKFGLGPGPVVGIIARLSDVKGHIYLIAATKLVLEKFPQAQLLIIGEGKMQQELLELTKSLEIEKNVFFIPRAPDTREALMCMDVFVMPSLKEGLGLALMEAMAQGLPVIGSSVGGIKSLIRDRENGLLVRPQDASSLSQALLELLGDPQKARSLGEKAKVFISNNFSQEKMAGETEKLYSTCLNA